MVIPLAFFGVRKAAFVVREDLLGMVGESCGGVGKLNGMVPALFRWVIGWKTEEAEVAWRTQSRNSKAGGLFNTKTS